MNETKMLNAVTVYADGACSGNPGPGGWGAVLVYPDGREVELAGSEDHTTNNRMELMAAIQALTALEAGTAVDLYTDSMYVRDGMTKWTQKWAANGWQTADKKPVKNVDLWQQLTTLASTYRVAWHWVRGHSGHTGNERADLLARNAVMQLMMAQTVKGANGG